MSMHSAQKSLNRTRRHRRIRATMSGTAARPRLAVFRSVQHIAAQIINDETGKTLVAATDRTMKALKGTKTERAAAVGKALGEAAKAKNISAVVFDRGGSTYHGRIKALADAARAAGLIF